MAAVVKSFNTPDREISPSKIHPSVRGGGQEESERRKRISTEKKKRKPVLQPYAVTTRMKG